MASKPYFKFYPGDYLADTGHLSTVEHGAYLLLIIYYCHTGKALPNDEKQLSNIVKMSLKSFRQIKLTLSRMFTVTESFWEHKRIEQELAGYREKSSKSKASSDKRWLKDNANALQTDMQTHIETDMQTQYVKDAKSQVTSQKLIKDKDITSLSGRDNPPGKINSETKTQTEKIPDFSNVQIYLDLLIDRFPALGFSGLKLKTRAMFSAWEKLKVTNEDILQAIKFCEERGDRVYEPTYYANIAIDFAKERQTFGSYSSKIKKTKGALRSEANDEVLNNWLAKEGEEKIL